MSGTKEVKLDGIIYTAQTLELGIKCYYCCASSQTILVVYQQLKLLCLGIFSAGADLNTVSPAWKRTTWHRCLQSHWLLTRKQQVICPQILAT